MYKCEDCGELSSPGVKLNKVVVETRLHYFPYRKYANLVRIDGEWVWREDIGGKGLQIVREIGVCKECKEKRCPTIPS